MNRMGKTIADKIVLKYGKAWPMFGSAIRESIVNSEVLLHLYQQDSSITDNLTGSKILERSVEWKACAIARLESLGMSL